MQLSMLAVVAASTFNASAMLDIQTFAGGQPIALSSDGQWVAYVLTDITDDWNVAARRPRGHIHVQRIGGPPESLSDGKTTSSFPTWSPDGRRLALFLEDDQSGQLAVWDRSTGVLVRMGERFSGRAYLAPQWDPSGERIVYAAALASEPTPPRPDIEVIRSSDARIPGDAFFVDGRRARLVAMHLETDSSDELTTEPLYIRAFRLERNRVHYRTPTPETFGLVGREQLSTQSVSLDGAGPTTTDDEAGSELFRLVPDPTLSDPEIERTTSSMYSIARPFMDLYVGERNITAALADQVSDPAASSDGRHIVFRAIDNETYDESLYLFTVATERLVRLASGPERYGDLAVAGGRIVFTVESATHPADLHTIDLVSGDRMALTRLNPQLASFSFSAPELFYFHDGTGERLGALLYKPTDMGPNERVPVITYVYEKLTPSRHRFQPRHQIFVSHGYAVLLPNVRVRLGETGSSFVDAVVPAVNRVREMGFTNGKFCLWGGSFGAYATSFVITQTSLFDCAVSRATPPELFRNWASGRDRDSDNIERGQARMGGSPFEVQERYISQSAFFHLDKVETPVLILHGIQDKTILVGEGEMMFYALRRLGKQAELVLYRNGDHSLYRHSRHDAIDVHDRMLAWFAKFLRP